MCVLVVCGCAIKQITGIIEIKNSCEQNNGTAWGESSSASVNPKGKEKAWVSAVHGVQPAKRQHSPSHGEEEVSFAACAGIPGFICPRKTLETLHCVWRQ